MGTSLNGLTPQNTYQGLLKFGDNSAISSTLKAISDGNGNDTLLSMSTSSLNIGANNISARLGIKGSGSTSATTSLLVQNSAGTQLLKVTDDGATTIGGFNFVSTTVIENTNLRLVSTSGGISVNSSYAFANPSAQLDVASTTKGFLPPRMTTTQKNAIASPASGLQVYDTTLNQMSYYNGTTWINF